MILWLMSLSEGQIVLYYILSVMVSVTIGRFIDLRYPDYWPPEGAGYFMAVIWPPFLILGVLAGIVWLWAKATRKLFAPRPVKVIPKSPEFIEAMAELDAELEKGNHNAVFK